MKLGQYMFLLMLGLVCLGVSVATVWVAWGAGRMQSQLQWQQVRINSGLLGAQGQQVTAAILQELATVSKNDAEIRALLRRHGYTVNEEAAAPASGTGGAPRNLPKEN
jgi:hypothetical protein